MARKKMSPLDVCRIRQLMQRKGLVWTELSDQLGFNSGHLRRIQEGIVPDNQTLQEMAKELGVPLYAIDSRMDPWWEAATYANPESIARLDQEMEWATSILTFHRLVEFYALPESFQPTLQSRIQKVGYAHTWKPDQWTAYASGNFLAKGRAIRESSRFQHRILAPESFFSCFFEPEWIEQTEQRVKAIAEETALALLGRAEFVAVDREITKLLASHNIPDWDKLFVINDYLVAVRLPNFMYMYCYHRPTAQEFLEKLEKLVQYDQYMPRGDCLIPTSFRAAGRSVCERFQRVRRRLEESKPRRHD